MDCTSSGIFAIEIGDYIETNQIENPSETINVNKNNEVKTDKSIKIIFSGCFQWIKGYVIIL
jgi:hypothetical protein